MDNKIYCNNLYLRNTITFDFYLTSHFWELFKVTTSSSKAYQMQV